MESGANKRTNGGVDVLRRQRRHIYLHTPGSSNTAGGALEELESVDEYVWRYFLLARARATREGPHEQAAALARLPAEELVPPWERAGSSWLVKE